MSKTEAHLAAVKELRDGIEGAEKASKAATETLNAARTKLERAREKLSRVIQKADKAIGDLREATEGLVPRVEELKEVGGNEAHLAALTAEIEKEVSWSSWLVEVEKDQKTLDRVIGACESLAAWIDAEGNVDGVEEEVVAILGEERVREGPVFVEWFQEHIGAFNVENGHIRLALKDPTGAKSMYHAGKGNDPGLCQMMWEKVGRRWEWMSSHPGGFVVAGRELVAIGREKVGRVLMLYGHLGDKAVALNLALFGGAEMEGEVRDVIGIEPYGGGVFDESLEVRFVGHEGPVRCVADAGGGKIVTGGDDRTVKVWDVYTGKCLMTMEGHTDWVSAVVVVGGRVISGSTDRTLRVWSVESGECKQVVDHGCSVIGLCVVDESKIVSCHANGSLDSWKVGVDGQLKKEGEPKWHSSDIKCVGALGNGLVASGGVDGMVLVHDLESGDLVEVLENHNGAATDVAVLSDGRRISASEDGKLRVWSSIIPGAVEMVLDGHGFEVNAVSVLENGMIVSGDGFGILRLWSVEGWTWKSLGATTACRGEVNGLQALSKGQFVSVRSDGHVVVRDASRFDSDAANGHTQVLCCAILSDGRIVSGGGDGFCVFWSRPERGKNARREHVIDGGWVIRQIVPLVHGLAFSGENFELFLWELGDSEVSFLPMKCYGFCSMKGGTVLVVAGRKKLTVFNVEERRVLRKISNDEIFDVKSLDSERVVASNLNSIFVVNVDTGEIGAKVPTLFFPHPYPVDGGDTVVVRHKKAAWLYDLKGGASKLLLEDVQEGGPFLPLDADKLIVRVKDQEVVLWNWKTKETVLEFGGLKQMSVTSAAWDASRRLVVFTLYNEMCWIAYELF